MPFSRFTRRVSNWLGRPIAFVGAILVVLVWAIAGPIFNFSDTWQLIINTSTTVVTFWMVFIIENTQNRDAMAMHVKLDEVLKSLKSARDDLAGLEDKPQERIESEKDGYS